MNDRQRKTLDAAFLLLANGARRGRELAKNGTMGEVFAHVGEMKAMVREMERTIGLAHGAEEVLRKARRAG